MTTKDEINELLVDISELEKEKQGIQNEVKQHVATKKLARNKKIKVARIGQLAYYSMALISILFLGYMFLQISFLGFLYLPIMWYVYNIIRDGIKHEHNEINHIKNSDNNNAFIVSLNASNISLNKELVLKYELLNDLRQRETAEKALQKAYAESVEKDVNF